MLICSESETVQSYNVDVFLLANLLLGMLKLAALFLEPRVATLFKWDRYNKTL